MRINQPRQTSLTRKIDHLSPGRRNICEFLDLLAFDPARVEKIPAAQRDRLGARSLPEQKNRQAQEN